MEIVNTDIGIFNHYIGIKTTDLSAGNTFNRVGVLDVSIVSPGMWVIKKEKRKSPVHTQCLVFFFLSYIIILL